MAEAMFLDRNPEWGYVGKPNAPQHDVYRWMAGRKTPMTGQVKFHANGNPDTYARDMVKDYRSERFFIPDDHVGPTRAYLLQRAERLTAAGDKLGAEQAYRNRNRIEPMGAKSGDVISNTDNAPRAYSQEKYATYVSLGASLALVLGPTIWDWATGNLPANQAMYRTTRALSLLGVGVGTDALLAWKQVALRGTVRGNVIVGTALTITEVTWLLYEYGGQRAFHQPQFYESIGGSVTGIAFGMIGAGAAAAWVPGPGWVVGGSAITAGAVLGTVGYIGGRSATHTILEIFAPQMIHQREREQLAFVKSGIERTIAKLQAWPPKAGG